MSVTNTTVIAQWYAAITEKDRQCILSALGETDRGRSFRFGCAVAFDQLPQYAKNLVTDEWHMRHPPTPLY
jgi:hypothetical protein